MRAWIITSRLFTPPWQEGGVELTYLSKHPLLKIGPFVSVLYIVGKYSEVILPQSYQPAEGYHHIIPKINVRFAEVNEIINELMFIKHKIHALVILVSS